MCVQWAANFTFFIFVSLYWWPWTYRRPWEPHFASIAISSRFTLNRKKGVRSVERLNTLLWDCMIKCRWKTCTDFFMYTFLSIFFKYTADSVDTELRLYFWEHLTLQFSLSYFFEVARKNKRLQSNLFRSSRFQNLTICMQRDGIHLEVETLSIMHNTPSWFLTQQKVKIK